MMSSNAEKRFDTKRNKERILSHEYGHAIHFKMKSLLIIRQTKNSMNFITNRENYLRDNYDIKNFDRDWKELRYSGELYVKYGNRYTKNEITEMYLAVADHIGGLTRGRQGYGHKMSYYNSKYNTAKMEVFAHSSENYFVGNELFKDYFSDLYDESIKYMKEVSRVYGR
jgi:hypothetical protein